MSIDNQNHVILIVDDESSVRESLAKVLQKENFQTMVAENGHEAESLITTENVSLVLSDFRMPEMSGLELLQRIKKSNPEIEVVLITGHGTIERAVEAMREGAYDFVTKPFKRADILRIVVKALEKRELTQENKFLRQQLADVGKFDTKFIGESQQVKKMLELIKRVAPLPSTVLITGESGTGKEIIARTIHTNSPRHNKRFVAVNCGAISENLIESELFGHVKGSFTGAIRDKEGLFKTASTGTLFLDEISTIPMSLQVKLLRALEEHEILPVGATRPIPVEPRIIAASNRDLLKEVEEGRFREDLYYRLNVVGIEVPSLRERQSDIPLLVEHFIQKFNHDLKKNVYGVSTETLSLFLNYKWKGNVRELENAIERAMILCDGNEILPEHLPHNFTPSPYSPELKTGLKESMMEFERTQILKTLEMVDQDKKAAAQLLGLSLSSLYRKMSELGIDTSEK
ncbi:MAG: sigma-54-dependent Fis family transcriptional regulator [Deferribacteres bacterium]|nr:sigma-54-dependent Fis family transcriptional regulator [candidate division KSB1 bacterium]MCB9511176.1 sigma-54-dependent Fis family transcriptional regulator [Deferribacteres bacterium]